MATLRQSWALGPGNAGILSDLRLRFLDDDGVAVGSVITTGVVHFGDGNFGWAGELPSNDFEGFLKLYRLSTGEVFPVPSISAADLVGTAFIISNSTSSIAVALQAQGIARPVPAHVYIGQYDLLPAMSVQLLDAENEPVDLTTADSVAFIIKRGIDDPVRLDGAFGVQAEGWVEYEWAAGDTDTAGNYRMQIEITWATGILQKWPNDSSYAQLHITAALAEPEP